jgi:hypothetical protein
MLLYIVVVVGACVLIPVIVFMSFAVTSVFGIPWYVTAVSLLLVGRFIFGLLEH